MFKINVLNKLLVITTTILLLASCGNSDGSPKGKTPIPSNDTSKSAGASSIPPIPSPKVHKQSVTVDGKERKFSLYIPAEVSGKASIVFLFHGANKLNLPGGPVYLYEKDKFQFNKIAKMNNIIMVYPTAIERNGELKWDSSKDSTDLEFFDKMIDYLSSTLNTEHSVQANMKKVYVTGHSSGAIFSFALAGYKADKITASVPVSGQFSISRDNETVNFINDNISVPLRAYNGTKDSVVDYDGAYANMKLWQEKENKGVANNFTTSSITINGTSFKQATTYNVDVTKWQGGLSDLEMYSIKSGTHSAQWIYFGDSIWEFMNKYEKK